ncbi:unnamed protein product [Hapterophycus canaliculatus]
MIVTPPICNSIEARLESEVFTSSERSSLFATLIDLHAAGIPIDDPIVLLDRISRAGRLVAVGGEAGIEAATRR